MPANARDPAAFSLPSAVSRDFLVHHRVCPTGWGPDGSISVAVTPDSHRGALDDLCFAFEAEVTEVLVSSDELFVLIERLIASGQPFQEAEVAGTDAHFVSDVRDLANQPPVVRYVNFLLQEADEAGASDIHLEADRAGLVTRLRVDGLLMNGPPAPRGMDQAVLSRIKLLAELDIAERRAPQDGRMRVALTDRELDIRVSTVPTMFGESVVLRLLQHSDRSYELQELGLPSASLDALQSHALKAHGMILATGPTGSGKTTTLYAALRLRSRDTEKIITLEDPIEFELDGVAQVPVHGEVGVSFASALRSILRQDPDVIMVGEMRDEETADLAVQAALTGHLLFSTLHTNDTAGAIPRLLDLGVPPFLVAATLEAVLAQRLVRTVCAGCVEPYEPEPSLISSFVESVLEETGGQGDPVFDESPEFVRGSGCTDCRGSGFRGRVGLFELMTITDTIRLAIVSDPSANAIRALSVKAGMRPLRADGWDKVRQGLTTIEEVIRVTQS